ncbi:hypothetical protein [Streptomyces graminilatus]|uniref:hypothetical protein n=1 Tax=Streptomyces graminilatus TaxID=1464070 RepID=UPI0006E36398|nr:hypothetical protein [Streptomyces graminilatus]
MVKKHGKKQRARQKSRRTGAAHASAAAGTTHTHTPLPDMDVLPLVPHGAGRVLDLDLAARLVAACRAGCGPCQKSLAKRARQDRPTLAALAGVVFGLVPTVGMFASATTREWAPLARDAKARNSGIEALAAVEAMTDEQVSELLEDALDHWAAGGVPEEQIADMVKFVGSPDLPPRQRPADPMDAFRKAGIDVFTLDDLDVDLDGIDTYHLAENYGVFIGQTATPEGRPLPMLTLYPETEGAGIEDLERRTDWEHWGLHGMPDMDPHWRLRANIADRSLEGLVRVGPDGEDDIELWRAAQKVSLPAEWWSLLDQAQHVLVAGPVKEADNRALQAAGDAGELLAVVARVSFH